MSRAVFRLRRCLPFALFALFALCALFAAPPSVAAAQGWRTAQPAVMYDGPSSKARRLMILSGGFPLKEVSKVTGWHKVITHRGDSGWLTASDLQSSRAAVVISARAAMRGRPHPAASAVLFAKRDVILQALPDDAPPGWIKVVHQDGDSGYMRLSDVWRNF